MNESNPLFGSEPEALALIRLQLNATTDRWQAVSDLYAVLDGDRATPMRSIVGFGCSFFTSTGDIPRPCELAPMFFNGDAQHGLSDEAADLVVIAGGEWHQIVATSRSVLEVVRRCCWRLV